MHEVTRGSRAPACVLFNLPEYRVVDAVGRPDGTRQVVIEGTWAQAGCPD